MQRSYRVLRSFATSSSILLTTLSPLHAADAVRSSSAGAAAEAAGLVQAALEAELAGDVSRRGELLTMAVATDPDYAPARWHSGLVNFDGEWRSAERVQELVTHDARWDAYRELRDSLGDAPEDHLELAKWCDSNRLANEARYHWANVLLADPENQLARKALDVREMRGRLFTGQQVSDLEQMRDTAEKNLERYKPLMVALCRDVNSGDRTKREQALAAIRALADVGMMDALQATVYRYSRKSPRNALELQLAMISAFANMPQHAATLRLMNFAVFSRRPEVRKLAAESLRPRAETDYVPLLMSALTAPVEVAVDVIAMPDGTVRMTETIEQQGPESDRKHVRSSNFETTGAITRDVRARSPGVVLNDHLGQARAIAAATMADAESLNLVAAERNQRIENALRIATGDDLGDDPEAWWGNWQAVNELAPSLSNASLTTYEEQTSLFQYRQERRSGDNFRRQGEDGREGTLGADGVFRPTPGQHECFVEGTLVWTQAGPVAIETIGVGDLVLAQDPNTGEAAYRPVLETTFGPTTGVVDVQIGDETFGVTRGHRFWVNGAGWVMAKQLEPATPVHTLTGLAEVRGVTKRETVDCYNLVVDDFHTYFVGEAKILVHDKGCPRPVLASVPGSGTVRGAGGSLADFAHAKERPRESF